MIPIGDEPHARQVRSALSGDGWASTRASLMKPEWGTQKATKWRTRVANPTACAMFHPSIDRLSRVSPISKGKGKTRQGTLLLNKNDNHERSRRLEASTKDHRSNMSLANRGQQQIMPMKLDPWGGTLEL